MPLACYHDIRDKLSGQIDDACYGYAINLSASSGGRYSKDFINIRGNSISVGFKLRMESGNDGAAVMASAKQEVMNKIKNIVRDSNYHDEVSISVSGKFY